MKILFEEIKLFAYHGFYEEEQKSGHWFSIDLEVEIFENETLNDDLQNTFNYEIAYQICVNEMKQTQKLLETVAQNILAKILANAAVESSTIKLFKHAPHKMPDVKKVGISISKTKK
jgi:dihydroneopterin aldolase